MVLKGPCRSLSVDHSVLLSTLVLLFLAWCHTAPKVSCCHPASPRGVWSLLPISRVLSDASHWVYVVQEGWTCSALHHSQLVACCWCTLGAQWRKPNVCAVTPTALPGRGSLLFSAFEASVFLCWGQHPCRVLDPTVQCPESTATLTLLPRRAVKQLNSSPLWQLYLEHKQHRQEIQGKLARDSLF